MKRQSTILLLMFYLGGWAQTTEFSKADSLKSIWNDESYHDTLRLNALDDLIWEAYLYNGKADSSYILSKVGYEFAQQRGIKKQMADALSTQGVSLYKLGNFFEALTHYEESLAIYRQEGNVVRQANLLNKIGNVYNKMGDYPAALNHYQQALKISEATGKERETANVLSNIGSIYYILKDFYKTLEYYNKSLQIEYVLDDKYGIGASHLNIGNVYSELEEYEESLEHNQKSLTIFESINHQPGIIKALTNIGVHYNDIGEIKQALNYYNRSLKIAKLTNNDIVSGSLLSNIGKVYLGMGNYPKAIEYCQEGLELSINSNDLQNQKKAYECLYDSYKMVGNNRSALRYYENLTFLDDSIFNEENTKKLTRLEMQFGFDKQVATAKIEQEKKDQIAAKELQRQKLVRNGFMIGFSVVLLFAGTFFVQRIRIGKEKKRSEKLLLNILPETVAQELKEKGKSEAQLIDQASVLFTDFKGFTAISEKLSPEQLVQDLHDCFSAFDLICEKYHIEKIKTIGDAYMAAGGLPIFNKDHAKNVVLAALEMAQFVEKNKESRRLENRPHFEIRIGIHTGPLVAGIVGIKKFQYDIWGDTVNIASRMESSGAVGKVNISQRTYEIIKDNKMFKLEYRGKLEAKGKGAMDMWFVDRA